VRGRHQHRRLRLALRQGRGYSQPAGNTVGQTFCRGIQVTDNNGAVAFTTIYPGWYASAHHPCPFPGISRRQPEGSQRRRRRSLPSRGTSRRPSTNSALYAARGQDSSVTSVAADNAFSDGTSYQMATLTGDLTSGYTANLTVGIAA
jgi:hypothetical protein